MTEKPISIIEAPLSVGAGLAGVEMLPAALLDAGLAERVGAARVVSAEGTLAVKDIDRVVGIPEPLRVRSFLLSLADKVEAELREDRFPLVLGGDCTVLLGCLAGAGRNGNPGLFFLDGHTDFNAPGAPDHETASMDLAIASGYGPDILTALDGKTPLVAQEQTVVFGVREENRLTGIGGNTLPDNTDILHLSLAAIREFGFGNALKKAMKRLAQADSGFWLHLDVDVLDDAVMPAVDYRMPGGLSPGEVKAAVAAALETGKVSGMNVTILNPKLDWNGQCTGLVVSLLAAAFSG
ncbi:arginase family protein [Ruegeria atlantica]|uniref:arginase family protein n=1 Tax=Ruegeria atlantica TaxID=81569 RepID=UPI001479E995|nr:arginase family protein [Ruegeria atlantica]